MRRALTFLFPAAALLALSCAVEQQPQLASESADAAPVHETAPDVAQPDLGETETAASPEVAFDSGTCKDGSCFFEGVGQYDSELCLLTRLSGTTEGYSDDYRYLYSPLLPYFREYYGGLNTSARLFVDNLRWQFNVTSENEDVAAAIAQDSYTAVVDVDADPQLQQDPALRQAVEAGLPKPSRPIETDSFSAAASCIPWSALGFARAPRVSRIDLGGPGAAALPADAACFLSEITNDFRSGTADLTSGSLVLSIDGGALADMWAAATCFSGLSVVDVPLADGVALPGFCGLASVGHLATNPSNVNVGGPVARMTKATGTARCIVVTGSQ